GISAAGVGLGVALIPQLAALLIGWVGWRMAYVELAVAVLIVAFVPVALFLREPPPDLAASVHPRGDRVPEAALPRVAPPEALGSSLFWALSPAFLLGVVAINGTLTHIVALLTDRGVPLQAATAVLSGTGVALIIGRIFSGWCLDRIWGLTLPLLFSS